MAGMGEQREDGRLSAPAADRNKAPILAVLQRFLPKRGTVLEVASGTGQHVVHHAAALPALTWQPSDIDAEHLASIAAWTRHCEVSNVRPPVALDVGGAWPDERFDALICCNMIHIAPWQATLDLVRGAAKAVVPGGVLFLYGPYKRFGRHTAPSNEQRAVRFEPAVTQSGMGIARHGGGDRARGGERLRPCRDRRYAGE